MSSNCENIPPQVIKKVLKEINEIHSEPLNGIRLISNEQDVCDIQALIDGPAETPYQNGFFRLKLILCKGFPIQPPKACFITKIFHPNVSSNGEICVNTLKKDWKPELGIRHILLTVKCLLIAPNPESALNEEAAKLLLETYEEYFSRAKLYTQIHARQNYTSKLNYYQNTESIGNTSISSSSYLSIYSPLDSNKTIQTTTNNSNLAEEPNTKLAKLQQQQQQTQQQQQNPKKIDKKKALKRL